MTLSFNTNHEIDLYRFVSPIVARVRIVMSLYRLGDLLYFPLFQRLCRPLAVLSPANNSMSPFGLRFSPACGADPKQALLAKHISPRQA